MNTTLSRCARALAFVSTTTLGVLFSSCATNEGTGWVRSDHLRAPGCYDGPFDLKPDFFASNPYRNSQTIRIQRGDDIVEYSDGISILVDDTARVRAKLGEGLRVGLPPEVTPPGVPITPDPDPPIVHLTLYLNHSCSGQLLALHGVEGSMTFEHLFSGDRNEEDSGDRLSEGRFDVKIGDPRDQPAGGGAIPEAKLSRLQGQFRFFFERGQPAQPFP